MADFWNGKEPCWEILKCPEIIFSRCPAYLKRERPCWDQMIIRCRKVLDFA